MQISPVGSVNYKTRVNNKVSKIPSFGSICPDLKPANAMTYAFYQNINPVFSKLRLSSTRIFRELPTQNAVSKLLNPSLPYS